jgi:hypothetical protein
MCPIDSKHGSLALKKGSCRVIGNEVRSEIGSLGMAMIFSHYL